MAGLGVSITLIPSFFNPFLFLEFHRTLPSLLGAGAVANCFLSQFMHVSMKVADLHRSLDAFRSAVLFLCLLPRLPLDTVSFTIQALSSPPSPQPQVQLPPSSEDPDVHFNCGTVHLYLQQFQDSYECFRKALTLDPSFEEVPLPPCCAFK